MAWRFCLQVLEEKDKTREETPYLISVSTQCMRVARKTGQGARGMFLSTLVASVVFMTGPLLEYEKPEPVSLPSLPLPLPRVVAFAARSITVWGAP